MKKMKIKLLTAVLLLSLVVIPNSAFAVGSTVIHGPYLVDMTDTAVTVMWYTSGDATGEVEYGTGGNYPTTVASSDKGLIKVGTRHEVRITGLTPGTEYNYRVKSRAVIDLTYRDNQFGNTTTSAGHIFKTFSASETSYSFYYMAGVAGDLTRYEALLDLIDVGDADFVAFGGNQFDEEGSGSQVFTHFIDPAVDTFAAVLPLVYTRGSTDMRGTIARSLKSHIPHTGGKYYYGFNHGQVTFAVIDTGESSPDNTTWMEGLTESEPYRAEEYAWLQNHIQSSEFDNQAVKIFLQNQPDFGYVNQLQWTSLANDAGIDLLIAGDDAVYSYTTPGIDRDYHQLVITPDQLAKIDVSPGELEITVYDLTGAIDDNVTIITDTP